MSLYIEQVYCACAFASNQMCLVCVGPWYVVNADDGTRTQVKTPNAGLAWARRMNDMTRAEKASAGLIFPDYYLGHGRITEPEGEPR